MTPTNGKGGHQLPSSSQPYEKAPTIEEDIQMTGTRTTVQDIQMRGPSNLSGDTPSTPGAPATLGSNTNTSMTPASSDETAVTSITTTSSRRHTKIRMSAKDLNIGDNQKSDRSKPPRKRKKNQQSPFEKLVGEIKLDPKKAEQEHGRAVIMPWDWRYKAWWGFSVFWSIMTVFFETYQIAFGEIGFEEQKGALVVGYIFVAVFTFDMMLTFNLAYFDDTGDLVTDRKKIARHYLKCMFWIDLLGVFPFYNVAVAIAGDDPSAETSQYLPLLRLLRLFRLVRLHRVKQLFDALQFNTKVSLMTLTLIRNFGTALVWTHFSACVMYYISRQYNFDPDETWIGGQFEDLSTFERYLTSLYWSVVTFTTVGYGDFSPNGAAEQVWGIVYMLLNMVLAAWMIGSITLLIVKTDEATGYYRDTLQTLSIYAQMHGFDRPFHKRLQNQVKLYFSQRQIADEEVLKVFPTLTRRKVLKRIYLPSLIESSLMNGINQQFTDCFLSCCRVEIFSPGDELVQSGTFSTELYLLVEGQVKILTPLDQQKNDGQTESAVLDSQRMAAIYADSDDGQDDGKDPATEEVIYSCKTLGPGDFINDVSFFTGTPVMETIQTATICKTLKLPLADFKVIAKDHPGSVSMILQNLLAKIDEEAEQECSSEFKEKSAARHDLIAMQIHKLKDDQIARILFAASRDHTTTIQQMCDQGFDPNSSDFDGRTALMVASKNDCTKAVKTLLENYADPNLVDVNGSTALSEAVKHGHDSTIDTIIEAGGKLCMSEARASFMLCQAVFEGDNMELQRLLRAGIQVNASNFDQRTAIHVAARSGNLAALKLLVEFGADLSVRDQWNNSVYDEAEASTSERAIQYLKSLAWDQ